MTDWKPIMGSIPPISEAQWGDAFNQYKQFPEYKEKNSGMSLAEFQFIFFWEYLHRMLGRLLGLVFLVPFAWFLVRRKFNREQLLRSVLLLTLGLGQGLMGWFMVQSGLIDVPEVSHYRLAAHLLLAFIIFGCCIWFALDLSGRKHKMSDGGKELKTWLNLFLAILLLQVVWGAFTAGLHAGHIYNSFPKMYQFWIPPEMFLVEPAILNFFQNMTTVQWTHRLLGTVLGVMVIAMWGRTFWLNTTKEEKKWILALFGTVLLQYAIGVFTLIYHVPLWLGVLHQVMAMILFGVALGTRHRFKNMQQLSF
jgi:cytochrome c oxidase assembly protein subunit 15